MPKFRQTGEILRLMNRKECIRNVGIIAHIDHGKTTMTDSLLAEAGLLSPKIAGEARALDYLEEEQRRGITIKTANISLLHEVNKKSYVVNLVDTPGHVDFTGKVTRALRAIDGAIVVVDAVEEIMVQTETVTRQALNERVRPVLFINKIDRLIRELKLTPAEIQNKLERIIRDFNNLIEVYGEPEFKDKWKVSLQNETVAFGSALHRWGLTFNISQKTEVKFKDIIQAYSEGKQETLERLIPLHSAILDMIVKNIPNPVEAQKYRIPKIWKGELDSEIGKAILNCDDKGPTVMCITNVQADPHAGLIATGRVFSGTIKPGAHIYLVGARRDHRIQQVFMYMGALKEVVEGISAGNIAAILGPDMVRAGETIVDAAYKDIMIPFERIRYLSEPVMTIAVEPEHPRNLPQLLEAMNRLTVEDPNIVTTVNKDTGEYLLSGMGELHLEIAVKMLRDYTGFEILTSKPLVIYREGITTRGKTVTVKSINLQNIFQVQVEPLEEEIVKLIENGRISEETGRKGIIKILTKEAGWSEGKAYSVLAVNKHANILLSSMAKDQIFHEAEEAIIAGFKWACRAGPLCEEPLRGVKVEIINAQISKDLAMGGAAQITPTIRRGILGSVLTANPVILEPIYRIEVSVPPQWVGECINIIKKRRGRISSSEQKGFLNVIEGYIPVAETFGLTQEMRSATSGRAFWQCTFSHWEKVPENIAIDLIKQIREKKGLPIEIPTLEKFIGETE
ncbi:elongation factor EF-2 [Candidatus Bathyarchaeota archaeon]|nr:elongation factor EF-2 [Candidatus Bathyarchaeota archaeon]